MSIGILVAVGCALLVFWLSGARTTAYLLYFLAFVPFISLDLSSAAESGFSGQNVLFKMSIRLLVTAGFVVLLLRRREGIGQLCRLQSIPVLFFFAWALLSVQRAQAPFLSLFRLGELLVFFLAGVVLFVESARFHGPRAVARWHCLALLQIPLVTLFFLFTQPELAYYERADGIGRLGHKFINANSLGFACVAVILWSTVELKEKREHARGLFFEKFVPLIALIVTAYVMFEAHSRTAMITTVLGQLIIWFPFTWKQAWRVPAFGVVAVLAVLLAFFNTDAILEWFLRGDSADALASGTGRTVLWKALLVEQLPKAPLLGAGYLALSENGTFFFNGVDWSNAHNTYVFALISTGIPGFLAILLVALAPWAVSFRRQFITPYAERPFWILLFAMQTVILVASITGFGICGYPNPAMMFHYALYSYMVTRLSPRRIPAEEGSSGQRGTGTHAPGLRLAHGASAG